MKRAREQIELELLVVRAQLGERSAFTELVECWQPRLIRYVSGMLSDRIAADDVVQEIWIAVFRALPRLREPGRFIPWVFTIARRSVTDRLRVVYRHSPEVPIRGSEPDRPGADDPLLHIEDALLISAALAELNPIEREVAWLAHFEDRPLSEIAEITEVPVGTVKSRLFRARTQLKSILDSKGYQP